MFKNPPANIGGTDNSWVIQGDSRQFCSLHTMHPSSSYPIHFCRFFTPVQAHLQNAKVMVQVAGISKSMRVSPDTYHTLARFSCSFPINNWCRTPQTTWPLQASTVFHSCLQASMLLCLKQPYSTWLSHTHPHDSFQIPQLWLNLPFCTQSSFPFTILPWSFHGPRESCAYLYPVTPELLA